MYRRLFIVFFFLGILLTPLQSFAQFSTARTIYQSELNRPSDVALADIDGDGREDLVVASLYNEQIVWYPNQGGNDFGSKQLISNTEGSPEKLFTADLDGDSDKDIVSWESNYSKETIVWYENMQPGISEGSPVDVTAEWLDAVKIKDINGDSLADIIYADDNAVWWNENLGGRFARAEEVRGSDQAGMVKDIEVAELNGDQKKDIVVAHEKDSRTDEDGQIVWFQNRDSTFSSSQILLDSLHNPTDLHMDKRATDNGLFAVVTSDEYEHYIVEFLDISKSITPSDTVLHRVPASMKLIKLIDKEADGDRDFLVKNTFTNVVGWMENTGDGFRNYMDLAGLEVSGVITEDIVGDSRMEIVLATITNDNVRWYQKTDSLYQKWEELNVKTVSSPTQIDAVDINQDGNPDVVSFSEGDDKLAWYENEGSGFGQQRLISDTAGITTFTTGNVDDDQESEIVAGTKEARLLGYDKIGSGFSNIFEIYSSGIPDDIEIGDLDADNDKDIVQANRENQIVWHEKTAGDYRERAASLIGTGTSVEVADMDNDGINDVLTTSRDEFDVFWYSNADGNFDGKHMVSDSAAFPKKAIAVDFDNDQDQDVMVISNVPVGNPFYENKGEGDFKFWGDVTKERSLKDVITADFTNNGFKDVITAGVGMYLYKNNNMEFTRYRISDKEVDILGKADIDQDNDIDVIAAKKEEDTILWFENLMNETAISESRQDQPDSFVLSQNYPNPFNPTTNIRFSLPRAVQVTVNVYNTIGQRIRTLVNRKMKAGSHSVMFNAGDLPSGVYIYRLKANGVSKSRKMLLLK